MTKFKTNNAYVIGVVPTSDTKTIATPDNSGMLNLARSTQIFTREALNDHYTTKINENSLAMQKDLDKYLKEKVEPQGLYDAEKFESYGHTLIEKYRADLGKNYADVFKNNAEKLLYRYNRKAIDTSARVLEKRKKEFLQNQHDVFLNEIRNTDDKEDRAELKQQAIDNIASVLANGDPETRQNYKDSFVAASQQDQVKAFVQADQYEAAIGVLADDSTLPLATRKAAIRQINKQKQGYVNDKLTVINDIALALKNRTLRDEQVSDNLVTLQEIHNDLQVKAGVKPQEARKIEALMWQIEARSVFDTPVGITAEIERLNADNPKQKHAGKIAFLLGERDWHRQNIKQEYDAKERDFMARDYTNVEQALLMGRMMQLAEQSDDEDFKKRATESKQFVTYMQGLKRLSYNDLTKRIDGFKQGKTMFNYDDYNVKADKKTREYLATLVSNPVALAQKEGVIPREIVINTQGQVNYDVLAQRHDAIGYYLKGKGMPVSDHDGVNIFTPEEAQALGHVLSRYETEEDRRLIVGHIEQISTMPHKEQIILSLGKQQALPPALVHAALIDTPTKDSVKKVLQGLAYMQENADNDRFKKTVNGEGDRTFKGYLGDYFNDNIVKQAVNMDNLIPAIKSYYAYLIKHDSEGDKGELNEDLLEKAIHNVTGFKKDDDGTLLYYEKNPNYDEGDLEAMDAKALQAHAVVKGAIPILPFTDSRDVTDRDIFNPNTARSDYRFVAVGDGVYQIEYYDEVDQEWTYVDRGVRDKTGNITQTNEAFEFQIRGDSFSEDSLKLFFNNSKDEPHFVPPSSSEYVEGDDEVMP